MTGTVQAGLFVNAMAQLRALTAFRKAGSRTRVSKEGPRKFVHMCVSTPSTVKALRSAHIVSVTGLLLVQFNESDVSRAGICFVAA